MNIWKWMALVVALLATLVLGGRATADYLPSMPPGTGNFGKAIALHTTDTHGYPNSGYHWDDPTTLGDDRDIPAHYMRNVAGIHVASPLGAINPTGIGAGDALDFHWVWVGAVGDYFIWDMVSPAHGVRVYPAADHGPYLGAEFDEFDVFGSNDQATWDLALETAFYYDDINNIRTHDGVKDYTFGSKAYRYIKVQTNALGGGDMEIDAVEEITVELPPLISKTAYGPEIVPLQTEASWTFVYNIVNTSGDQMCDIRVKDIFGANLNVADDVPTGQTQVDLQGVANRYQTDPSYYDTFQAGWDSRFNAATGPQTLGGVDFNIGEKIIILHGSESSPPFPSSVSIPVGQAADKLHFLGNVAGWAGTVGDGSLVGRYVVHFGDGTSENVDLIKNTTIDEWLISVQAHSSTATTKVLEGVTGGSWRGGTETWHLDLLTVDLGAAKYVDSIEFTDAGNAPAPVLFAVTTELSANPSHGSLHLYERPVGKSVQYRFMWDDFCLEPDESASLVLVVSTGTNPKGKQEFTSPGTQVLNSGANIKWVDSGGVQQSAESESVAVCAKYCD